MAADIPEAVAVAAEAISAVAAAAFRVPDTSAGDFPADHMLPQRRVADFPARGLVAIAHAATRVVQQAVSGLVA